MMHKPGRFVTLFGLFAVGLLMAPPAVVQQVVAQVGSDTARSATGRGSDDGGCGKSRRGERGYEVIFDGSRGCFERWRYAGGSSVSLQRDGTLQAGPGAPNLGVLWYAARPYGDFSLRLQFRDDSPIPGTRANSGVQVSR